MPDEYPERWLLTDERVGDLLWAMLARLPPRSGVIFRHHATPAPARRAVFQRVRRIARARRLVLLAADPPLSGAAGRHGRVPGATSWPAHDRLEARAAKRHGARLLILSPAYPTRSHPGAAVPGPARLARLARDLGLPMIALGGMTERRYRRLRALGFTGWAAIDAWGPRTPGYASTRVSQAIALGSSSKKA